MKTIYWQIQGVHKEEQRYHSDGWMSEIAVDRAFLHKLLDEWLDNLENSDEDENKGLPTDLKDHFIVTISD